MYTKLLINTKLKVLTGLHIGGSSVFSAIGAVDSPVVYDPRTKKPIVPGSSLKGKLRTLLARIIENDSTKLPSHNKDNDIILRLFGSSGQGDNNKIIKARLQFADAFIINDKEFKQIGLTEIKFENTIDRDTLIANPRQIERVNSGVIFEVKITYDLVNEEDFLLDIQNLAKAMKLLQLDYLGGHGTRGSGRVSFTDFNITDFGESKFYEEKKVEILEYFKEVESYELFSTQA